MSQDRGGPSDTSPDASSGPSAGAAAEGPPRVEPPRLVTRRTVIVSASVAAGTALVGGIGLLRARADSLPAGLAANLARLPGREQLGAIGRAIEDSRPERADVGELTGQVAPAGAPDPLRWCSATPPDELTGHVERASRANFASGELVEVEGWRLGRSEAALCVLVARI